MRQQNYLYYKHAKLAVLFLWGFGERAILVRFVVHLLFMEAPLTVEATVRRDHNAITIYMCESRKSRNNWQ